MKTIRITIQITLTIILLTTCGESIVGPNFPPGRRDYVWTIDTINTSNKLLNDIWGSSKNDVWLVGQGSGKDETIWHYDGDKWSTDKIFRIIDPCSIYGFSYNDIWLGGGDGEIWHYDGKIFSRNIKYFPNSNWSHSRINSFVGKSSKDIYAVGYADSNKVPWGRILHYNGSKWSLINVSSSGQQFLNIEFNKRDGNYYIYSYQSNQFTYDSVRIYSFNGTTLKELYKGINNDIHGIDVREIGSEIYFAIDNGVYTFENNSFKKQFTVENKNFAIALDGRSKNDIFLWMWDGVAHYDGDSIEYLIHTKEKVMGMKMLVLPNDLFIVFFDNISQKHYVYHGTLNY